MRILYRTIWNSEQQYRAALNMQADAWTTSDTRSVLWVRWERFVKLWSID